MFDIQDELRKLPDMPGVYIMYDAQDVVIYVGKSKSLKNRVRSYFLPSAKSPKHLALVPNIVRFEYIVTNNETEAFLLECTLIKRHRPRYNVMLKDDKTYPYIKITLRDEFPRAVVTRQVDKDGSKYFGPYPSAFAVNEVMTLVRRLWRLRSCERDVLPKKGRACLNRDMGLCLAPCRGDLSADDYAAAVKAAMDFLGGKHGDVLNKLEKEMYEYSESMDFEKAASARDAIYAVRALTDKQNVDRNARRDDDMDAVGFCRMGGETVVQVFFVRGGKVVGRERHAMINADSDDDADVTLAFVTQFYESSPDIPPEICLQTVLPDGETDVVTAALGEKRGGRVVITVPQRGEKMKLVQMARNNAKLSLERHDSADSVGNRKAAAALREIADALGLAGLNRIESYDISNTSGAESVGSMVTFEGGKPKRSDYRKFKIKGVVGADDYASMEEVLTRRFKRLNNAPESDNGSFAKKPDVLFIDGGEGHVTAAERALTALGLSVPICGMVKDDRHRTRALLFNGAEVEMKKTSEGFKLVTRIQDETHRFAIEYHRKLREKKMVHSEMDDIKGVGKERKRALTAMFGTVDAIKAATVEELLSVDSMNITAARAVWGHFHGSDD